MRHFQEILLAHRLRYLTVYPTTACGATLTSGILANGVIEAAGSVQNPGVLSTTVDEVGVAFLQMGAAGVIGGVQSNAAAGGLVAGTTNPVIPVGGSWVIGSSTGAAATGMIDVSGLAAGVYIASSPNPAAAIPTGDVQVMTPVQAANIDRKIDDGQPNTGIVRAIGNATPTASTCTSAVGGYNESLSGSLCGVYAKVQ